jgi:hypothetical protein
MPTVVGLFDSQKDAEDAIAGLVEAGFERFDISLLSSAQTDQPAGPDFKTAASGLAAQGLTEDDMECYSEGMRRGGTIVAVRSYPHAVDKAAEVMRRLGAVDVSARPGTGKFMERVQPFGEMMEGNTRPMRAGQTEAERGEERSDHREERRGQMDPVYGAGLAQKGEEELKERLAEDREDRPQKKNAQL